MKPHGTSARYSHGPDENDTPGKGCRCAQCTAAVRSERRRQRAEGPQLVSSTSARVAVNKLIRYGWTRTAISRELGVSDHRNLLKHDRCTRSISDAVRQLLADTERTRKEMRQRRFPIDAVYAELDARGVTQRRVARAEFLGIAERQLIRWEESGIPLYIADRIAATLERHPVTLWPDFDRPEELPHAC